MFYTWSHISCHFFMYIIVGEIIGRIIVGVGMIVSCISNSGKGGCEWVIVKKSQIWRRILLVNL